MTASLIAQLVVALGPSAFKFIQDLTAVWNKPELTAEEVDALCAPAEKSYDAYVNQARAKRSL